MEPFRRDERARPPSASPPAARSPRFGDVTPSLAAATELRWFFNDALIDVEGTRRPEDPAAHDVWAAIAAVERRAEAVHAAWRIAGWLERVRVEDARMLEALYTEWPWPERVAWAGQGAITLWRPEAELRCGIAVRAYDRARGGVPCVAPE